MRFYPFLRLNPIIDVRHKFPENHPLFRFISSLPQHSYRTHNIIHRFNIIVAKLLTFNFYPLIWKYLALWNMFRTLFTNLTAQRPTTFLANMSFRRLCGKNLVTSEANWSCGIDGSSAYWIFFEYNFSRLNVLRSY